MLDGKSRAVHVIGEDGLGVKGVDQIDAFVILAGSVERLLQRVRTIKDKISRAGLEPGKAKNLLERCAGPFADATPALDAIMAGDLGSGRQSAQVVQR